MNARSEQNTHPIILKVLAGSHAYGLATPTSDHDVRGVFLAPTVAFLGLSAPSDERRGPGADETHWELGKFVRLALQCNPNILEVLFSPEVIEATSVGHELLAMRGQFLSQRAYPRYRGYAQSEFAKIERQRASGRDMNWKNAMHTLRLLSAACGLFETSTLPVHVGEQRDWLLSVRRGEHAWDQVVAWRAELEQRLDAAYASTALPENPDVATVESWIIQQRLAALHQEGDC